MYTHASYICIYDVVLQCSSNANRCVKKRTKPAFTCSFSSFSPRFFKMFYQSVSDFIFRFTLAIRRCTTTRSFSCFCQPVFAQYRSLRSFIRENHAFWVYLSRVTAPFFSLFLLFFYYILIYHFFTLNAVYKLISRVHSTIKKLEFIHFTQTLKEKWSIFYIVSIHVYMYIYYVVISTKWCMISNDYNVPKVKIYSESFFSLFTYRYNTANVLYLSRSDKHSDVLIYCSNGQLSVTVKET